MKQGPDDRFADDEIHTHLLTGHPIPNHGRADTLIGERTRKHAKQMWTGKLSAPTAVKGTRIIKTDK